MLCADSHAGLLSLAWPATEDVPAIAGLHLSVLKFALKVQGLKAHAAMQVYRPAPQTCSLQQKGYALIVGCSSLPPACLQAHDQQWPYGQQADCRGASKQ